MELFSLKNKKGFKYYNPTFIFLDYYVFEVCYVFINLLGA